MSKGPAVGVLILSEEQGGSQGDQSRVGKGENGKGEAEGSAPSGGLVRFGFAERGWKRSPFYQCTSGHRNSSARAPVCGWGSARPCILPEGS